jgi:hypothetical protein
MIWKRIKLPRWPLARISWQRPSRDTVRKMVLAGLLLAAVPVAFYLGRQGGLSRAHGQQTDPRARIFDNMPPVGSPDYGRRVVAYIYGSIPITREEFGEYLIDRVGPDRVDFLVNRRIIEIASQRKNIIITPEEVQAQFAEDLKGFGCGERQFIETILRPRNKTLLEWKEDVIKPKLCLQRLVQGEIVIQEEDLQKAFEAKFGEKVKCRIIVLTKEQQGTKFDLWNKVSKDGAEFERMAKTQSVGPLAAQAGMVPPIHRHFEDPNIEAEAFKLRVGEVSPLIDMPDKTTIILRCEEKIPKDTTKKMSEEREMLYREVYELKLAKEIPKIFQKLRDEANPQIFMKRDLPPAGQMPPVARGPQAGGQPGMVQPPAGQLQVPQLPAAPPMPEPH